MEVCVRSLKGLLMAIAGRPACCPCVEGCDCKENWLCICRAPGACGCSAGCKCIWDCREWAECCESMDCA